MSCSKLVLFFFIFIGPPAAQASVCEWIFNNLVSPPSIDLSDGSLNPGLLARQLDISRSLFKTRIEGLQAGDRDREARVYFQNEIRLIERLNSALEKSIETSIEAMKRNPEDTMMNGVHKRAVRYERQLIETNKTWLNKLKRNLADGGNGVDLFLVQSFESKLESLDYGLKHNKENIDSFRFDRKAAYESFRDEAQRLADDRVADDRDGLHQAVLKQYDFEVVLADALSLAYSQRAETFRQKAAFFSDNIIARLALRAEASASDRMARKESRRSTFFSDKLRGKRADENIISAYY
jgi:hypothetical protein